MYNEKPSATFESEIADLQTRIIIRDGIKRGLEKCKHHKFFSKRVVDAVKKELPDYYVSEASNYACGVEVWSKDIPFNNSVDVKAYTVYEPAGETWFSKLMDSFKHLDYEKRIADLESEREVVGQLEALHTALLQLKETARAALPTNYPSKIIGDRFPELFSR